MQQWMIWKPTDNHYISQFHLQAELSPMCPGPEWVCS